VHPGGNERQTRKERLPVPLRKSAGRNRSDLENLLTRKKKPGRIDRGMHSDGPCGTGRGKRVLSMAKGFPKKKEPNRGEPRDSRGRDGGTTLYA